MVTERALGVVAFGVPTRQPRTRLACSAQDLN